MAMPEAQVKVTLVSNGGAFGGKEDMSVQAQTALLARVTGKPVKLTLSREESLRLHPKRHPIKMTYTVGCDKEGRLTAVRAFMVGDKGAYASVGSKVLERAAGHCTGPYRVPNVEVTSLARRMRIAGPTKRAEPVGAPLTAKRIEIERADDPLVRADARAAPHAGASAARTPHDDMVQ